MFHPTPLRLVFSVFLLVHCLHLAGQKGVVFEGEQIAHFARSSSLTEEFNDFQIIRLDVPSIDDYVHHKEYDGLISLSIGRKHLWRLLLLEHDIRSTKWIQGGRSDLRSRNITFRGMIYDNADSKVRFSINGHFFSGFIDDGENRYFIEPLRNFLKAAPDLYILYQTRDIRDTGEKALCGAGAKHHEHLEATSANKARTQPPACLTTEVAIALDFSYVDHHGGYTNAVNQAITVMNNLDPNFDSAFESDIDFEIVEIFAATTAAEDPAEWTSTVDGDELLSNFRSWGNSGGFLSDFDLGQLWTKRNFHYEDSYGVVGLAYVGTACNYSRYHLLEHYSSNADKLRVLTAHEIGHNFGAGHDTLSAYIMKPSVNQSATTFSQMSIDAVNLSLGSRSCLSDCNLPCPDGMTITLGDPVGNYEAGNIIRTIGTVTVTSASTLDAPEVQLYPNFSSTSGVVFEIRNDGCN